MENTRADVLIGTKKQKEFFSDFVTSFRKTPIGDELGRVVNESAVNQSIRNIIKTNLGERLFQPTIGSDILYSLFENNNGDIRGELEIYIENALKLSEPRVMLKGVEVNSDKSNNNAIDVTIVYNLINNPEPITLTVVLRRVR